MRDGGGKGGVREARWAPRCFACRAPWALRAASRDPEMLGVNGGGFLRGQKRAY